jgi:hypothetical protein
MVAIEELLLTKAIVRTYSEGGLTDVAVLRRAIARSAGDLHVVGRVKGLLFEARPRAEFAVAYVVAETSRASAHVAQAKELDTVRSAYQGVIHGDMRERMATHKWKEALQLWEHLRGCKLVSPDTALDAARCFHELKEPKEVVNVLKEALRGFGGCLSADWLEQCGDLALEEGGQGHDVALSAYTTASQLLLNTRSGKSEKPGTPRSDR